MGSSSGDATVLIVDDERAVADAYTAKLREEYETRTAYSGEGALETVDEGVDVVLLDRRMPDYSGDDVLERIRDRGLECRVIMVTAVDPDVEIVEMLFEDYLRKPASRDDLLSAIEQQLRAAEYDERITELIELTTKLGLLERDGSAQGADAAEGIEELRERVDRLRADVDEAVEGFDDSKAAFEDLL
jgi:DNA-binding NtrC family response regulator